MERMDQDRLAQLAEAARHANGDQPDQDGNEPVRVAVERRTQPARGRGAARRSPWLAARLVGALAVLAVGAVHLQQYENLYSAIPTIGTLFVLNFAGATAIGLGLLAPLEGVLGRRWGGFAVDLLAVGGIGLAAASFAFLAISEQTPLFGFMEPGYDPAAILASRVAEAVAVVSLLTFEVARFTVGRATIRW
jgi:hypothetical protein